MRIRRRSLILAGAWLLVACGGTPTAATPTAAPTAAPTVPTVDPTARAQQLRVLCSGVQEWCAAMTAAFQSQTGIAVSFERLATGDSLARLKAGRAAPEFDVWHAGPADAYISAASDGLLAAYQSPVASQIPGQLKNREGLWTGAYIGVLSFCSNPAVLARLGVAAPRSWADLLDPKLKGQVAMGHPATSGTAYNALWSQVVLQGNDQAAALRYFGQLNANIGQYTTSGAAPATMAAKGELAVGIVFHHDCVRAAAEQNVALTVTTAAEGTGYEIGGVAVIEGAAHRAAAEAYVDWALSVAGQAIPATIKSFQLPTNPAAAIPAQAQDVALVKQVDYDFAAAAAARSALIEQFIAQVAPAPPK